MTAASDRAMAKFEEQFGKSYGTNTLMKVRDVPKYVIIPTGSLALDHSFYVGGLVVGRIAEYWGPDGVGKSTLSYHTLREAQDKFPDKWVAIIDVEHRTDVPWVLTQGVDPDRLRLVRPSNAEDVADILKEMIQSGLFSLITVDSVGAMISETEKQKDAGEVVVGTMPKVVTRMMKIAVAECEASSTTVLLINQVRASIGTYGADQDTPGGWALKHLTTQKVRFRRSGGREGAYKAKIDGEPREVGHEITGVVERNSVAPAGRKAVLNLFVIPSTTFGPVGIDVPDEALRLGLQLGVIDQKPGGYYEFLGHRIRGRENVPPMLRDHPDVLAALRGEILSKVSGEIFEQERIEEVPTESDEEVQPADPSELLGPVKEGM